MEFDTEQVAFSSQCSLSEIAQLSTKTLNDYNFVSRKRLEQIVDSSERHLTEDEHRWLIKRDCSKVISNIKRFTRKKMSKSVPREETNETAENGDTQSMSTSTRAVIGKYVIRNRALYRGKADIVSNGLNVDSGENVSFCNIFVENTFAVINLRQVNTVNVNNNVNSINNNDDDEQRVLQVFEHNDGGIQLEQQTDDYSGAAAATIAGKNLGRIYWNRWRSFVNRRTAHGAGCGGNTTINNCSEKIDSFLSRIQGKLNVNRAKKSRAGGKLIASVGGNNATRKQAHYDRQRAMIEDQKKLLEKQRTEIERLRLQQLRLESEKAMLENEKALQGHRRTHNEQCEKRSQVITRAAVAPAPARVAGPADIVRRMEMRALERRAKWEAVRERRRQAEREEQRRKRDLEERLLREEMDRKRERLFEARENARLKRIEECRRQTEKDVWREKVRIADDFRKRLVMRNGLEAFRANLRNARLREREASNFYNQKALKVCFSKWRLFVNNNSKEKIHLAEKFYKTTLMKKTFLSFFMVLEENIKKEQVAEDWYNFKIQEFWFQHWFGYTKRVNTKIHRQMLEAESHHNRIIMKRCFDNWRKFPEIIYKERLKDCRLRTWHEKVQEIIPDFVPPKL